MKLFFVLLFIIVSKSSKKTNGIRNVDLIDRNDEFKNYIFRGSYPRKNEHEFDYNLLKNEIINVGIKKYNISNFPKKFLIYDITLLNTIQDHKDLKSEENFWENNPEKGKLFKWPIFGTFINASDLSESMRRRMLKDFLEWDEDFIPSRLKFLNDMLKLKFNSPVIFYIHCEAGKDRTGELSASYYIRYQGLTFYQAFLKSKSVSGQEMGGFSSKMLQWYCFYNQEHCQKYFECDKWY